MTTGMGLVCRTTPLGRLRQIFLYPVSTSMKNGSLLRSIVRDTYVKGECCKNSDTCDLHLSPLLNATHLLLMATSTVLYPIRITDVFLKPPLYIITYSDASTPYGKLHHMLRWEWAPQAGW